MQEEWNLSAGDTHLKHILLKTEGPRGESTVLWARGVLAGSDEGLFLARRGFFCGDEAVAMGLSGPGGGESSRPMQRSQAGCSKGFPQQRWR